MTIHGDVQRVIEGKDFEPKKIIFKDDKPEQCSKAGGVVMPKNQKWIIRMSVMTCMHMLWPTKDQMTGQLTHKTLYEIFARIVAKVHDLWPGPDRVARYRLFADIRDWVPPQKKPTQVKRKKSGEKSETTLPPYPEDAQFTDDGGVTFTDKNKKRKVVEPRINITQMMSTRWLHQSFFERFIAYLQNCEDVRDDIIELTVTKNARVILEDGKKTEVKLEAPIGEDDLWMPYSARFEKNLELAQLPSVDYSKDRDTAALGFLHVHQFKNKVAMVGYGDGRFINLQDAKAKLEAVGWNMDAWIQAWIMNNTDYFGRYAIVTQINTKTVMASVLAVVKSGKCADLTTDLKDFYYWLCVLYSGVFGLLKVDNPGNLRCRDKTKKLKFPSHTVVVQAWRALRWNFHYWKSLQWTVYEMPLDFINMDLVGHPYPHEDI